MAQNRQCKLSGMPLKFKTHKYDEVGNASLDRIDSSKGYTIDNVQWVHKDINKMKWNINQPEFLWLCDSVIDKENVIIDIDDITKNFGKRKMGHWKGYKEIPYRFWVRMIERLPRKRKTIHIDITIEDIWNQYVQQNYSCALTNLPLSFFPKESANASIDRIDSNGGYTKDNIQLVLKKINLMKCDFDEYLFKCYCFLISNYQFSNNYNRRIA